MTFCSNCGAEYKPGSKFCSSCGSNIGAVPASAAPLSRTAANADETVLWEGKPSGLGDRVKDAAGVNSTAYTITNQRILIKTGLLGKKIEEIELVRVKDIKIVQSVAARMIGIGDVQVVSNDATTPVFILSEVRDPYAVKETLRTAVRAEKLAQGVKYEERF